MYRNLRFTALVVAGGTGKRMKAGVAKQFIKLNQKPMLYYSLKAFEDSLIDEIILVSGAHQIDYCREEIVEKYSLKKVKKIVAGGEERYHSVAAGLGAMDKTDFVLIHDGARPCINQSVIERCLDGVIDYGACTAGVKVIDTIAIANEDRKIMEIPNRNFLWSIQTPQCFAFAEIQQAHKNFSQEEKRMTLDQKGLITDDVRVYQQFLNKEVFMIEGSYDNIKVTTPVDITRAENILNL